ncbi:MAG: hypothetical protein IJP77_08210 [Bacteroidales bacterium]|nr:hypothetical protein [Bacteroidales bacterium]
MQSIIRCFQTFTLLLAVSLMVSCAGNGNGATARLDSAEALVQSSPDSALTVLRSIDTLTLTKRSLRARYSLLHAMALDKNWIDTTDVNIVMPAVDYYSSHGSADRRAKAYYYLGRVQYNGGGYTDAIVSFTKARESAGHTTDDRFKSLVEQAIGDTYGACFIPEEAYQFSKSAYEYALSSGDTILANASLFRMAENLNNVKRYDEADSLFQRLLSDSIHVNRQTWPLAMADYALMSVVGLKDNARGLSLFEKVRYSTGRLPRPNHWCAYAYALAAEGRTSESESIFNQLGKTPIADSYVYKVWKSKAAATSGDFTEAFELMDESVDTRTDIMLESLRQSVISAQRDYFASEKIRADKTKSMAVWIAVLAVVSAVLFSVAARMAIKKRNERVMVENASLQKAISSLSDTVTGMNVRQAQLQREYTQHLRSAFNEWGNLYKAYYHPKENTPVSIKDDVYYETRKAVSMLAGDKEGQKMLEKRLNEAFDDVMTHFRTDFPSREEQYYHFVGFVIAGFDASVLKEAFQIPSIQATYERKSRLKDTIVRSGAEHKEQYLIFFKQ